MEEKGKIRDRKIWASIDGLSSPPSTDTPMQPKTDLSWLLPPFQIKQISKLSRSCDTSPAPAHGDCWSCPRWKECHQPQEPQLWRLNCWLMIQHQSISIMGTNIQFNFNKSFHQYLPERREKIHFRTSHPRRGLCYWVGNRKWMVVFVAKNSLLRMALFKI